MKIGTDNLNCLRSIVIPSSYILFCETRVEIGLDQTGLQAACLLVSFTQHREWFPKSIKLINTRPDVWSRL